jgi:hypothetical protein
MAKRMSVTLEGEDEQALALFADPGTPEHAALSEWAIGRGLDPARFGSEASVVRALMRAGSDRLREQALDEGYAALAAATPSADRAEAHEARRRYVARTERQAAE